MFNNKEVILEYVKREGPVLPIQVAKKTNSNTMFAGAILSELIANKLIKISFAKVGGSPVYYVSGQEEKLSILYDHLPGKEKEAFALLKNNKVLLDELIEPSIRFALGQIKDFAFSFTANINNKEIKCWRWHIINEEEAFKLVDELFNPKNFFDEKALQKNEVLLEKDLQKSEEIKQELVKIVEPQIQIIKESDIRPPEILKESLAIETQIIEKPKIKKPEGKFYNFVNNYLSDNKINVIENEVVRKDKEIDFTVNIKSNFGELKYLVKALNKKSISDKEVILAFNKGSLKKLPVILLSNGKLSKKAETYIKHNFNGYLIFKNLP